MTAAAGDTRGIYCWSGLPARVAGKSADLGDTPALRAAEAGAADVRRSGFAYDGPMFRRPVAIRAGEVVERDGFVFADLLPET